MGTKKTFLVMSEYSVRKAELEENDFTNADEVKAQDHEEAAEEWAEKQDEDGEYLTLTRGRSNPIKVQEKGSNIVKTFIVFAEARPVYTASEIEERDANE